MKTNEILNGNKLIAEFMGLSYCTKYQYEGWYKNHEHNYRICGFDGLKYHSSWDWLMPVVEKIEQLGAQTFDDIGVTVYSYFEIRNIHVNLHWSKDHGYQLFLEVIPKWMNSSNGGIAKKKIRINVDKDCSKIEAVWLACVEFIKWHNKQ